MTFIPPQPDDVMSWITVRLHANGQLSISGTIGDKPMALSILEHAKDAITRQVPEGGIIVPGRDVEVSPSPYAKEMGMIPKNERGDA